MSSPESFAVLEQAVRRVRARLALVQRLDVIMTAMVFGLGSACLVVALDRVVTLPLEALLGVASPWHLLALVGLAALVAVLAGLVVAQRRVGVDRLGAALEIDRACELRERVGTVVDLERLAPDSPGLAEVRADALAHAPAIRPELVVPYRTPRGSKVAAGLAILYLVLALVPRFDLLGRAEEASSVDRRRKRATEHAKEIREIAERAAATPTLAKLDKPMQIVRELEELAKELEADELPHREAALKLSRAADDLDKEAARGRQAAERARQMAQLRNQLSGKAEESPASKLEQALARGDLDKAAEALREMASQAESKESKDSTDSKNGEPDEGAPKDSLAADEAKRELMAKSLEELSKRLEDKDPELAKQLADAAKSKDPKELADRLREAGQELQALENQMAAVEALQEQERAMMKEAAELLAEDSTCQSCGKPKGEGDHSQCQGGAEKGSQAGGGGLSEESDMGQGPPEALDGESGAELAPPSRLSDPSDSPGGGQPGLGQGPPSDEEGENTGGEGRGRGGDPGETAGNQGFVDTQVRARELSQGIAILRKVQFGLPEPTDGSDLEVASTLATLSAEMEEALSAEEIPREYRERIRAYNEACAKAARRK